MRRALIFIFLIFTLIIIPSCATNPVTGKKELMLISEKEELSIGKKADKEIRKEYRIYKYDDLNSYINEVGKRLLKYVHRKNLKYSFTLLDSPVVNAFSIPGGYVYITRGILAYMNNEAQLASVLGHELGHINARHAANMISKQILFNIGLATAYITSKDFRKYAGIAVVGGNLLFLKFSRNDEYQADELGVEYATEAGYDTYEMAKFFKILDRLEKEQHFHLPEWFATHPSPPHRIKKVKILTAQWQKRVHYKKFIIGKVRYLKHIDGILFGKDKRYGYVEGNTYYHPIMRFTFKFPKGWKLVDTNSYILVYYPKFKKIQILITISKEKYLHKAVEKFIARTPGKLIYMRKITINGYPAFEIMKYAKLKGEAYNIKTYFIDFEDKIFVINSKVPIALLPLYNKKISMPAKTFKKLNDPKKIYIKNTYVKVVKAYKTATLKELLKHYHVRKKYFNKIALINGIYLNDKIEKGELFKILIEKQPKLLQNFSHEK